MTNIVTKNPIQAVWDAKETLEKMELGLNPNDAAKFKTWISNKANSIITQLAHLNQHQLKVKSESLIREFKESTGEFLKQHFTYLKNVDATLQKIDVIRQSTISFTPTSLSFGPSSFEDDMCFSGMGASTEQIDERWKSRKNSSSDNETKDKIQKITHSIYDKFTTDSPLFSTIPEDPSGRTANLLGKHLERAFELLTGAIIAEIDENENPIRKRLLKSASHIVVSELMSLFLPRISSYIGVAGIHIMAEYAKKAERRLQDYLDSNEPLPSYAKLEDGFDLYDSALVMIPVTQLAQVPSKIIHSAQGTLEQEMEKGLDAIGLTDANVAKAIQHLVDHPIPEPTFY